MDLPRYTDSIRFHSNFSDYSVKKLLSGDSVLSLDEKQAFEAQRDEEQCCNWNRLMLFVRNNLGCDSSDYSKLFDRFHHSCLRVLGPERPSSLLAILPVTILCELFKLSQSAQSPFHLEYSFATYLHQLLTETVQIDTVKQLTSLTTDIANQLGSETCNDIIEFYHSSSELSKNDVTFDEMVPFKFPSDGALKQKNPDDVTHISMFYPKRKVKFDVKSVSFKPVVCPAVKEKNLPKVTKEKLSAKTDEDWLMKQLAPFAGKLSLTPEELTNSVFEVLMKPSINEEIQNDLFDLIGYDGFDTIEKILEQRQNILSKQLNDRGHNGKLNQPTHDFSSLVGESGELRQAMQVARNEMKNISRTSKMNKMDDPKQQAPSSSSNGSTSSVYRPAFGKVEKYPFVFDRMRDLKSSAAFISNSRIALPADVKRTDHSTYEEVVFPATSPDIDGITQKFGRIKISEQDELLRIAFKNTKELNLIQSVVFQAAYGSNENMLVSAPTGAGKTNVAMLCILHELKQHFGPGNVLKLDEFKIIYVAPMKALAAEMTANFGSRLRPLGISVRECTGDMSLTKSEIASTQMLVTTPEKWDVMTRKSTGDVALVQLVRLLIIDEVHLLHEERGAVIESLVARTLRQVETAQQMIRILGLSATLPNYIDVAQFLLCNPYKTLFYFDGRFRPVPLGQTFIGVKNTPPPGERPSPGGTRMQLMDNINNVCYNKVLEQVRQNEQVMVFVHARSETFRTCRFIQEMAKNLHQIEHFRCDESPKWQEAMKRVARSRDGPLKALFADGFACHHAGMLRADRTLVEQLFSDGLVRVLCCTATLAWGVNLPAHCVVIKGTDIYDAEKSSFVDLGILDVLQIFGRAGRPQFDKVGYGVIITAHEKLAHYLSLIMRQNPIESQFHNKLVDNLNAEIALGTVTNVAEAVQWLSYTFLFVRMKQNPLVYGATAEILARDPELHLFREELITVAARRLDLLKMARFDERNGYLAITDLGRTASHFYIKNETIEIWNELFLENMTNQEVFKVLAQSQEFAQIKVREEESEELLMLNSEFCRADVHTDTLSDTIGKVNVLLQAFISRASLKTFSLVSDQNYIQQNSSRLMRCLFEISIRRGWPSMTSKLLQMSKMLERRIWTEDSPLWQFQEELRFVVLQKIDEKRLTVDAIREMDVRELGDFIRDHRYASEVKRFAAILPYLQLSATSQPITRSIIRITLLITPNFRWTDRWNSRISEPFWLWVEDPQTESIYHSEYFLLTKKQVLRSETIEIVFTIPIFDPVAPQYYIRINSDRWLGCDFVLPVSFRKLILPHLHLPYTDLLDLDPLPSAALHNQQLQSLYKFTHFNPIQTQIFHTLYHTDENVLLGAPTGSGKTVAAELAIFRVFREYPNKKCVYIAPLKALVRERVEDWERRLGKTMNKKVVELTGDVAPDMRAVAQCHLIVTTPEKWDGISRSWQQRHFVQDVALLVIDEIHLLGEDRGPVLEVIVSRINFISSHTKHQVRVVGLSTAVSNASDLASWLNIGSAGMFNFRPSVRPVPLEVHIQGFPGQHYCPRMATMNKPIFQAIRTHSPAQPVLIFVSSRRQTRITALDLIAYLAPSDNPKQWLHIAEEELGYISDNVRDSHLKLTLAFGIGMHHAGLTEKDRKIVEDLFVNQRIQVLIATSTLAWGVNYPAHLVIVKGTEYFDGKTKRYVDFPITDVMQMMGRAGRPQFDTSGKAVIMVHDVKKHFYKRFLYEPFPVESSLLSVLAEHLNAEIVAGTINSKQEALDYLTWTFFFRRLLVNPSYYHLEEVDKDFVNKYLSQLIESNLETLEKASCIVIGDDDNSVMPLTPGRIASYYYLSYRTIAVFQEKLGPDLSMESLIDVLSSVHEFAEIPVRHNEDQLNLELSKTLPLPVNPLAMDSSHTKANLLLQAHFSRAKLPITDYITDTKSVLDQAIRITQAIIDSCADRGWLITCIRSIQLIQMIIQGRWIHMSSLLQLPMVEDYILHSFVSNSKLVECLPELMNIVEKSPNSLYNMLKNKFSRPDIEKIHQSLMMFPILEVSLSIQQAENKSTADVHEVLPDQLNKWTPVLADEEYALQVNMKKVINKYKRVNDIRAMTPRFPKPKDEGWILVLGDPESNELIAIKRVNAFHQLSSGATLIFFTPEEPGRLIYHLYVFSDSYIGLDQQFEIRLNVSDNSMK